MMKKARKSLVTLAVLVCLLCLGAGTAAASTIYRYVLQWSVQPNVTGLDVGDNGFIYVPQSEGGRGSMHIYAPNDGREVYSWELRKTATTAFPGAEDVAVSGAQVFVTIGSVECLVARYSIIGTVGILQNTWGGGCGSGPEQFDSPRGIDLDAAGNISVADSGNDRIQVIKTDNSWWSFGAGAPGGLDSPIGLAVSNDGYVYVLDDKDRVLKYDTNGNYVTSWGSYSATDLGKFADPYALDVDADGNIFVADTEQNLIKKFTPDGSMLTYWGGWGDGNGKLNDPRGIAVDKATGQIYVADTVNERVQKFDGVAMNDLYVPVVLK